MITVNLQQEAVEIESLGGWLLNGQPVPDGTRVTVLPSLAADLIARGKARRVVAVEETDPPPEPAPDEPPPAPETPPAPDEPPPAPETPPAPAVAARGKK